MKEILSRNITHPDKIEDEFPDQGVALVVLNARNQFLLVRQAGEDERFGPRKGLWNIITETREPGELVNKTVNRGLEEETGQGRSDFIVMENTYRETNGLYKDKMGYPFKFRCCAMRYLGNSQEDPTLSFGSSDGEIDAYLWADWGKLENYKLEHGAKLVLQYYGRLLGFLS